MALSIDRRCLVGSAALSCLMIGSGAARGRATRGTRQSAARLTYDHPAANWNEALPVGNGRLGAMIFGGVAQERFQLNEDTLWAGSPYVADNADAHAALPAVRRLIDEGKFTEADALIEKTMMARPVRQMPYGSMGDIYLTFVGPVVPKSYRRELDLETATATIDYDVAGGRIRRECLCSAVDGVLAVRLTASGSARLSFDLGYRDPREVAYPKATTADFVTTGPSTPVDWLAVPYAGDEPRRRTTVSADGGNSLLAVGRNEDAYGIPAGLRFATKVAVSGDGDITVVGDQIRVRSARTVTLLVAGGTSFVNFADTGGDPVDRVRRDITAAARRSFAQIRRDHVRDYRSLYDTMSIDLGRTAAAEAPTDQRLRAADTVDDPALAALYVQYARYLLISSSRPATQPANLQGIWNEGVNPPWGSKYTININTQMNYWLALSAGLAPCFEPLVRMVEDLAVTGARTARTMYRAGGWVAHHNTDLWRASAPIDHPKAGMWPTGGAWLCNALWDRYEYHPDPAFLRRIYPLLRNASLFFVDALVEDPQGRGLVTSPSLSPENRHIPDITICAGPAMDRQILRDLFDNTIAAGKMLELDADLLATLEDRRSRLAPDRIGAQGQLQEWMEDWDANVPDLHHRHVSHLYAVFPGAAINVRDTPALIDAAKVTLRTRGDLSTGWATAWRICLWARMAEGEHAHRIVKQFVSRQRQYPNLLDAHPPFQIDGNFGGAAGIIEMLVQSWGGEIRLLPALPSAWPNGSLRGVRARGGIIIDVTWAGSKVSAFRLKGSPGAAVKLRRDGGLHAITLDRRGLYQHAEKTA